MLMVPLALRGETSVSRERPGLHGYPAFYDQMGTTSYPILPLFASRRAAPADRKFFSKTGIDERTRSSIEAPYVKTITSPQRGHEGPQVCGTLCKEQVITHWLDNGIGRSKHQ